MNKLFNNWKREYESRLSDISQASPDVSRELTEGKQQLTPANYYATKLVGSVSSFHDMFKSDDDISVGQTNVSNGKPQAGDHFLLCAVMVQYGLAAGVTAGDTKATAFGLIPTNMRNGEIEISQNKRVIMEKQLMEIFYTADHVESTGDTNSAAGTPIAATMTGFGNVGYYELPTPKWIDPERKLDVSLEFASAMQSANANVRIILLGVKNTKV